MLLVLLPSSGCASDELSLGQGVRVNRGASIARQRCCACVLARDTKNLDCNKRRRVRYVEGMHHVMSFSTGVHTYGNGAVPHKN